ncbi:MAG: TetR/AcrR family transcriptional regulator [Bacteroidetes bacterium]|nr:TetR/AcrR family transcriptional regulator [Bacteroidota bacterium]
MTQGRPKQFDEKQALDRALDVFCKRGYEASSMEDLLKAMKLGKSSVYHSFGSKKELFKQALDRYVDLFLEEFNSSLEQSETPMQLIKEFMLRASYGDLEKHRKGCFMGNSLVELASIEPGLSKSASDKLMALEEVFYVHARRSQIEGHLSKKLPAKAIAKHLITLWNGINVTRRMYPDQKTLSDIIEFNFQAIEQ